MERDTRGRFIKGMKGGPGRPVGTPNKMTSSFKRMMQHTVERLGPEFLIDWARENPGEFYRVASKLIPTMTQVSGVDGEAIEFRELDAPPRPQTYDEWIANTAVQIDVEADNGQQDGPVAPSGARRLKAAIMARNGNGNGKNGRE